MEFQQIAEREVDSVVQDLVRRLTAAADSELGALRRNLESDVRTIRQQADALREELETESARAATLEADLDSVIEAHRNVDAERVRAEAALADETAARTAAEQELAVVRELLDTARRELTQLQESIESEAAIKAILEADLAAVRESLAAAQNEIRALQDSIQSAEAAASRLQAELNDTRERADAELRQAQAEARELRTAAEAQVQQVRQAADARIQELTQQATAELAAAREAAAAAADAMQRTAEADMSQARDAADARLRAAQDQADAELRAAREEADAELRQARQDAEADLRQARDAAAAAEKRIEELAARLASSRDELAQAHEQLQSAQAMLTERSGSIESHEESLAALQAQWADAREAERALQHSVEDARVASVKLREELQAEAGRLRDAVARAESAEAATRIAEDELAVLRTKPDIGEALLQASVRALESLSASTSVAALMAALSRQLAPQFDRVAIFRVKGHHLEGEQGAGLDPSTDVSKLSIPIGLASPIARAATTRTVQDLDLLALAEEPSPLGGSPSAALAVPIVYQGETFAVAYVDRSDAIEVSRRSFVMLLASQSAVLLGRLSQELKLMKELRDYAALLVQEAEQMFVADVESGRPEADRRRRLAETIDCARQLFSQRAALDGPAAARALDDYLLDVMTAPSDSPFAAELTIVLENQGGARKTG